MKNRLWRQTCVLLFLIFTFYQNAFSQQSMAIGDVNPKSNAILYLKGNGTQGLIIPIVSSLGNFGEAGMMVYNNGDKKVYYHDGTNWVAVSGSSGGDLVVGNEIASVGTNGGLILSGSGTPVSPLSVSLISGTTDGQTLKWNGTTGKWELAVVNQGLSSSLNSAQIYVGNASNVATPVAMSGDVTINSTGVATIAANSIASAEIIDGSITAADISSITPVKIAQGGATTNDVLKWNGTAWAPAADAQGTSALNSGQILIGNASNVATPSTMSGDATISNTGVLTISTNAVGSSEIADGTVSSAEITDASIVNADVSASAAIAGTKVSPNFGSQNVVTTGSSSTGPLTASGAVTFNALAGTGVRMVTADAAGVLSTQSVPASFSTSNIVPKGDGTTLIASQIYDNGTNIGIGTTAPSYLLDVQRTLSAATDTQLRLYNPSTTAGDRAGIRLGLASGWAVQLQTVSGTDWLQLTNNQGNAYHRWTSNSYYPGSGGTAYIQGTGSTLALNGANVQVENYIQMGAGAPFIKNAKYTGTMPAASGATVIVKVIGVTADKILSVSPYVAYTSSAAYVPPSYTYNSNYEFHYYYYTNGSDTDIYIVLKSGNDSQLQGRAYKVFVTYEQ